MKPYLFAIIIMICLLFENVICPVLYNSTEVRKCTSTKPSQAKDCYNQQFSTLMCCYFTMTLPDQGTLCVPMSQASSGNGGAVSVSLPKNVNITGSYDCKYVAPTPTNGKSLFFSYSIIFILILII